MSCGNTSVCAKNTGGSAVSLKGWVLKDASNHKYVFPNVKDTATLTRASGAKVSSCSWTTRDPSDTYC